VAGQDGIFSVSHIDQKRVESNSQPEQIMRKIFIVVSVLSLTLVSGIASAKGCIAGAAVGGVAGHVAGKHGLIGAAAGCAVGRHNANKKDVEKAQATQASQSPAVKQ